MLQYKTWFRAQTALFGLAASFATAATVSVTNPTDDDWKEAPVVVRLNSAADVKSAMADGARSAVQADDLDGDGKPEEIVFLAALKPHETKKFTLSNEAPETSAPPRAHAGMYIKSPTMKGMEGPGWESDLIAFRIYWDSRNATDVFCKTEPVLSLEAFASKGMDYHNSSKWGMDVLKVGTALGIGGFGVLDEKNVVKVADAKRDFKLLADGPIRAVCDFLFTDWTTSSGRKLDLTARQLIYAGQTWAECQLTIKANDNKPPPELVAGVVQHPGAQLIKYQKLGVAGTWGNQALGDGQKPHSGNLGLGVTANPEIIDGVNMDPVSLYMRLKAPEGKATYRYVANWFKQPDAVKSAEEFRDYMARVQRLQPQVKIQD
ncbi:MAG: DUF4861 family protein [Candidatus Sumerlaeaceae bacterium]